MARRYLVIEELIQVAESLVGKTIGEIDSTGRINHGKGSIGNIIEESGFQYQLNSRSEPDFADLGIDLKVTPYLVTPNGEIKAKERLVITIIDYMTEHDIPFKKSSFWHKSRQMLIMTYQYIKGVSIADFVLDNFKFFTYPDEDLIIIRQDWEKITNRIKRGEAHLITEGETLYLAACPKGANSSSLRPQPFSPIMAMQRAYSLKTSYMTIVMNRYIFNTEPDNYVEHIIKNLNALRKNGFESCVISKLEPYYGMTQNELMDRFGCYSSSKSINERLLARMLGISGKVSAADEFRNANILPKTIRIQKNGNIKESMSFPAFKFTEIIEEDWENSTLRQYIEPAKFLFVIFRENEGGEYVFERSVFWNIPMEDLEEVHKVWQKTVDTIKEGVELTPCNGKVLNNLPKATENRVAHVRPHAKNGSDTYPLPDGREMTKQCFWLNSSYIEGVVEGLLVN